MDRIILLNEDFVPKSLQTRSAIFLFIFEIYLREIGV